MNKIYVVIGPTSSGKSDYAVNLAISLGNAEIVSADSRQVYKELNLLSGKIKYDEMRSVPHHMLSVVSVAKDYSVELFANQSKKIVLDIINKGKVPIICGGSGFYIKALIDKLNGVELPTVEPNLELRKKLKTLDTDELFEMLTKKDPERASSIDSKNKVRLIRALEIVSVLGKVPSIIKNTQSAYEIEYIKLDLDDKILKEKIKERIENRIDEGMIKEAVDVYNKIGYEKMSKIGLECRYCADYIEGKTDEEQLKDILLKEIWHYAKRQRTYFKKYF